MTEASENNPLPKELFAFAKTMGIDMKSFEPEAQDIWKKLTEMSFNNPVEYDSFVKQVMEENKEVLKEENRDSKRNSTTSASDSEIPTIRPKAGFCVICHTRGGDGIKVRDLTDPSKAGKALYINICSTDRIQRAKSDHGVEVDINQFNYDDLEIPMIIGFHNIRQELNSTVMVLDVVIHDSVVIFSLKPSNNYFQSQLVELVLQSIEQESDIRISKMCDKFCWKFSSKLYEFGRRDDGLTPALFSATTTLKESKANVLNSPIDLLKSMEMDNDYSTLKELRPLNEAKTKSKADSNVSSMELQNKSNNSVFKKGFLNSDNADDKLSSIKLSSKELYEVDKYFEQADDCFVQEVSNNLTNDNEEELAGVLKEFATVFTGVLAMKSINPEKVKTLNLQVHSKLDQTKIINTSVDENSKEIQLLVSGLSTDELTQLDLQVSFHEIILFHLSKKEVALTMSCDEITFQSQSVKAKASKKKGQLTITLKYHAN